MEYDVLVVSSHPELRKSIKTVLEVVGNFAPDRVGEAKSEREAVKTIDDLLAAGGRVGVVIEDMGIRDNGKACAELLFHTKANHPQIPIIVTSIYPSTQRVGNEMGLTIAGAALRLGAFAYVPKDRPIEELIGWVRCALQRPGLYK